MGDMGRVVEVRGWGLGQGGKCLLDPPASPELNRSSLKDDNYNDHRSAHISMRPSWFVLKSDCLSVSVSVCLSVSLSVSICLFLGACLFMNKIVHLCKHAHIHHDIKIYQCRSSQPSGYWSLSTFLFEFSLTHCNNFLFLLSCFHMFRDATHDSNDGIQDKSIKVTMVLIGQTMN
jgi:hypothetical protein